MDPGGVGRAAAELAVDILITNHNYGDYLPAAIESARAQTHPRVSTIVVDDGSTDGSRDVLRAYDGTVDAVLKPNGGQGSALNAGLERCSGDIVLMLDADDVLKPDAAGRVAEAFAADPDVVKVQFRMDVIDAAGRTTGLTKPDAHLPMPSGDMRRAELAFPFDLTWMACSGNAFRLAALRRLLPVPEAEYRICADWYLVHTSALLGPVVSLDDIFASYRMHGRNSYELQAPRLDLDHVRRNIRLAGATSAQLARLADDLRLERPERIFSVADLANRMISLRLDRARHPIAGDGRVGLVRAAFTAVQRRFDVGWPMKAMYVAWFVAMSVLPARFGRPLAQGFIFPARRRRLNRLLGRLHRPEPLSG